MNRAFTFAYAALAWAFVAGLLAQVFLIGLFIFDPRNTGALAAHQGLGWLLHLVPLVVLVFAYLARAGRRHWQWAAALAVVVFVVPLLATMRDSSTVAAALHPVGAMLSFALAALVAWNASRALQSRTRHGSEPLGRTG